MVCSGRIEENKRELARKLPERMKKSLKIKKPRPPQQQLGTLVWKTWRKKKREKKSGGRAAKSPDTKKRKKHKGKKSRSGDVKITQWEKGTGKKESRVR